MKKLLTDLHGLKAAALKTILLLALQPLVVRAVGQSDVRKVEVAALPEAIRQLDDITLALRWTDSLGDNVVVTTQNTFKPKDDPDYLSDNLDRRVNGIRSSPAGGRDFYKLTSPPFVHHFLLRNDSALLWRKVDGTGVGCAIKAKGNRVKSAMVVTDVDKDRIAEVWFIIKAYCNEDGATNEMKIIMHSANQRYTMSGTRPVTEAASTASSQYYFDAALQRAPDEFKRYAVLLWKRNAQD